MSAPEFTTAQMINWLRTGRLPAYATGHDGTPPMVLMRRAIAAHLSAAPDMLAALREISADIVDEDVPSRELRAIARIAREAIAKAEGR